MEAYYKNSRVITWKETATSVVRFARVVKRIKEKQWITLHRLT
jgi:hypothetical protein